MFLKAGDKLCYLGDRRFLLDHLWQPWDLQVSQWANFLIASILRAQFVLLISAAMPKAALPSQSGIVCM